jgi:V/A-type H+-transporting ATPase subunit D
MADVSPTRTELLTRQAQIRLARQGADLLCAKREALLREFLKELHSFVEARKSMHKTMIQALQCIMEALAIDGPEAVASAALACRRAVSLEAEQKNIWGTRVVDVENDYTVQSQAQRGHSPFGVTARVDEAAERFEQAVALILNIAPADLKLRALARDIRKTSHRVNALEQRLLPSLEGQVQWIRNSLDQREREDVFRLKRFKRGMERKLSRCNSRS